MAIFTSRSWLEGRRTVHRAAARIRNLTLVTTAVVFVQIIFGALLRHPGTGIDVLFAGIHIFWALVVVTLILAAAHLIRAEEHGKALAHARTTAVALLGLQFLLGMTAFFVLLDERGIIRPSNLQVIINSSHMVVGALLLASCVAMAAYALAGLETSRKEPMRRSAHLLPVGTE